MKTKLSKKQAEEKIEEFFLDIKSKNPEQIRKIKRLAMHYNIKLGDKRRKFCKFCYSPRLKVKRIKHKIKVVECEDCKRIMRWRVS